MCQGGRGLYLRAPFSALGAILRSIYSDSKSVPRVQGMVNDEKRCNMLEIWRALAGSCMAGQAACCGLVCPAEHERAQGLLSSVQELKLKVVSASRSLDILLHSGPWHV